MFQTDSMKHFSLFKRDFHAVIFRKKNDLCPALLINMNNVQSKSMNYDFYVSKSETKVELD